MLLTSEIQRAKYELGFNLLTVGAEPYISVVAIFDQVIQQYAQSGLATTSSTAVSAVGRGNDPVPVTLTVGSTGIVAFDRVAIDVDSRLECATVQSVSGSTITVLLRNAHSGTYPVLVEGGESIVRDLLRKLRVLDEPGGAIEMLASRAGVKKVDEIEFFGGDRVSVADRDVKRMRKYFRRELAKAFGIESYWAAMNECGGSSEYCP